MLEGYEENECPCYESDALKTLDKLLQKGFIELPESTHPAKTRITKDAEYYKYHRIIGYPIEKCKAFKEQVLQLGKEGKIIDEEDTKESD